MKTRYGLPDADWMQDVMQDNDVGMDSNVVCFVEEA
jgi:hypothetical protein